MTNLPGCKNVICTMTNDSIIDTLGKLFIYYKKAMSIIFTQCGQVKAEKFPAIS